MPPQCPVGQLCAAWCSGDSSSKCLRARNEAQNAAGSPVAASLATHERSMLGQGAEQWTRIWHRLCIPTTASPDIAWSYDYRRHMKRSYRIAIHVVRRCRYYWSVQIQCIAPSCKGSDSCRTKSRSASSGTAIQFALEKRVFQTIANEMQRSSKVIMS